MTYITPGYKRYRITIEYKGDCFYGWQRQKLTPTVQAEIEDALLVIAREKIIIQVVTSIEPTLPDFHARFSALSRSYHYFILNRRPASVLQYEHAWHIMRPLNHELMHEAAQLLLGHHDFSAFRDSECQAQNPHRTLDVFDITREGDIIRAHLKSRAFLHHQVRIMMGTLRRVGHGIIKPAGVLDILASRERKRAGQTAPAHALFFLGAEYPEKYDSKSN